MQNFANLGNDCQIHKRVDQKLMINSQILVFGLTRLLRYLSHLNRIAIQQLYTYIDADIEKKYLQKN